jgi:hypothetical protein
VEGTVSVQAITSVLERSELRGTARLVLLALANYEGTKGICPSIDRVAQDCRMSRRAVQEAIKRAREAKELHIERNAGPHGTNRYWLHIDLRGCQYPRCEEDFGLRFNAGAESAPVQISGGKLHPNRKEHIPEREITSVISLSGAKRLRARDGSPRNDPIYETLFALETGEPYSTEARSRLTRKAADALNAAAAEIRATGITEDELRAAIAAWPRVMGDATCTAHAVAKHLPRLRAAARGLVARRSELDEVAAEVERRLEARGSR